ncbi:GTPase domain-containing protein [Spirulina sp. 06S082]|uniref:GTPase domain-containing protein n=1 Tax=Spirulina sp. 06S082 TaxID=3110248 RepID=UPI002B211AD0|nr:GTPase domain-containing protein [Spirulina sp. 06S082]MEA5469228.1 GTPase domain-containing protein [Spirulina sp. 06S082]
MTVIHFQDFGKTHQVALKQIERCNVLVIGNTGVGKTSLIRTITQTRLSTRRTDVIPKKPYTPLNIPIRLYDTPGLEREKNQVRQVKKDIFQLIKSKKKQEPKEQIHIVWFCINAFTTRESDIDIDWIEKLSKKIPVIMVITRSLSQEKSNFIRHLESNLENLKIRSVIPILAESQESNNGKINPFGLDKLQFQTEKLLDEIADKATQNSVNAMAEKAFGWCRDACGKIFTLQASLHFFPVPFAQTLTVPFLQARMIKSICKDFKYTNAANEELMSISAIVGLDGFFELILRNLPIDYNNIQNLHDILSTLCSTIQQSLDGLPFTDGLVDAISTLADSDFMSTIPILTAISGLANTLSVWFLGYVLIESLKEYKLAEYKGEAPPNLQILVTEKIQFIQTSMQQAILVSPA